MKKITAIFLMLAMLLPVCFSAVSCSTADKLNRLDEYERAFELYTITGNQTALKEKDSYTLDMNIDINIDLGNDVSVAGDGKAIAVYYSEKGENFSYTESLDMDLTVKSGNVEQVTNTKTMEGYMDGKMFISSDPDSGVATIWSELSKDEYLAFLQQAAEYSVSDIPDISKENCESATAKQNEDGTWTATFSGFSRQSVEKMDVLLFETESFYEGKYDFCDLEITLNTSKDFVLTSIEIKPIFKESENKPEDDETKMPEIVLKQEIKDINSTQKPASLEFKDENKVQDLRLAYEFEIKLKEFKKADEGSFTVIISQQTRYGTARESYKETDTISYSGKNGDLKYELTADTSDNDITMKYEEGNKHVLIKNSKGEQLRKYTESSTNAVEAAFINSLLGCQSFSHTSVTDISDVNSDRDILKLMIDDPDISSVSLSSVEATSAEIRPAYDESGNLESYVYVLDIQYWHAQVGRVYLTITYTVNIQNLPAAE